MYLGQIILLIQPSFIFSNSYSLICYENNLRQGIFSLYACMVVGAMWYSVALGDWNAIQMVINLPLPKLNAGLHLIWISLHSLEIAWIWNLYSPLLKDYQHLKSDWLKRTNLNYFSFHFSLWVTWVVICNDSKIIFRLLFHECHSHWRSSNPASSWSNSKHWVVKAANCSLGRQGEL